MTRQLCGILWHIRMSPFFWRKEKGRLLFPASSTISLCPVLRENQVRIFQFLIIFGVVSVGMQLRCAVCETSSPDLFPAKMETSGTIVMEQVAGEQGQEEKATRDNGKRLSFFTHTPVALQPPFCPLDPQCYSADDLLWNMPRQGTPLALFVDPEPQLQFEEVELTSFPALSLSLHLLSTDSSAVTLQAIQVRSSAVHPSWLLLTVHPEALGRRLALS